jgi:hypothetical protein
MSKVSRCLARVPLHWPAGEPSNLFLEETLFPLVTYKSPDTSHHSLTNMTQQNSKLNSLTSNSRRSLASKGLMGALMIASGTTAYGQIISMGIPADFTVAPGTANAPPVNWDINLDGTPDFTFTYRYPNTAAGTNGVIWQANMNPFTGSAATNGAISYQGPFVRYAFALANGANIGPGGAFSTVAQVALGSRYRSGANTNYYGGFAAGPNANGAVPPGTQAFVGFRFNAADGTHYGWIRLSVGPGSIDFVSAAYQAMPNTAIAAGAIPEPGTLGLLALGAVGVAGAAIKRRRSA